MVSRRQTLTRVSSSELWLHALHGMEWSRSLGELARCLRQRIRPTPEASRERADMVRTQLWLQQGPAWAGLSQRRRILRSEEHTSELQSRRDLVCRLLLEKK